MLVKLTPPGLTSLGHPPRYAGRDKAGLPACPLCHVIYASNVIYGEQRHLSGERQRQSKIVRGLCRFFDVIYEEKGHL